MEQMVSPERREDAHEWVLRSYDSASHGDAVEAIKALCHLWVGENAVKTQKLTLFIATQAILASGYALGDEAFYFIPAFGALSSFL